MLEVWRDVSLIWLILLTLVAVLPIAVIFFFGIKGLNRVRQLMKKYLPIAQVKARQLASATEQMSGKIAKPVISASAASAQAKTITRTVVTRREQS